MAKKLNKAAYLHTTIHCNIVKTTYNITIKKNRQLLKDIQRELTSLAKSLKSTRQG